MQPSGDWRRIDTVRGVACILLVSFHALGEMRLSQPRALDALAQLYAFLAIVRMPLFIFLSGYVYALRPLQGDGRRAFLVGKARRLLVPLAFVTAVLVVARELFGRGRDGSLGAIWWAEIVTPSYHLWYLEALILIFVAIAAGGGKLLRSILGCAVLLAAVAVAAALGLRDVGAFSAGAAVSLMPYFILGVAAARFRDHAMGPWARAGAALVLALTAVLWSQGVGTGGAVRYAVSTAALLSVFVLVPSVPSIAALGRRSMAIYLYHFVVVVVFAPRLAGGAPLVLAQLTLLALLLPVAVELAAERLAPALLPLLGGRASRPAPRPVTTDQAPARL